MCNQNQTCRVELTIPANASMLLVVRLTTAGVLARAPIGVDKLDDVKMAVEEACHCMMSQVNASGRIGLEFYRADHQMNIVAHCLDCRYRSEMTSDPLELEVIRNILESLMDAVEIRVSENWIQEIRMRLTLAD